MGFLRSVHSSNPTQSWGSSLSTRHSELEPTRCGGPQVSKALSLLIGFRIGKGLRVSDLAVAFRVKGSKWLSDLVDSTIRMPALGVRKYC